MGVSRTLARVGGKPKPATRSQAPLPTESAVWIPAFAGMTGLEIGKDWRNLEGGAAAVRFSLMPTRPSQGEYG